MAASKTDLLPISSSTDIVLIRQEVRKWAVELGFSLVDQTKMITAASELARNSLDYGGGGTVRFETVENGVKRGLRLTFEDQGPGIPDIDLGIDRRLYVRERDGPGLGRCQTTCQHVRDRVTAGEGTRVTITRWK